MIGRYRSCRRVEFSAPLSLSKLANAQKSLFFMEANTFRIGEVSPNEFSCIICHEPYTARVVDASKNALVFSNRVSLQLVFGCERANCSHCCVTCFESVSEKVLKCPHCRKEQLVSFVCFESRFALLSHFSLISEAQEGRG